MSISPILEREDSPVLHSKAFILLFGALFSFTADQLVKFWVTATFRLDESLSIIPGFFSISLKTNPGAAFGIFRGQPVHFFLSVSFIAIVFIMIFVFRADSGRRRLIRSMALILGGALGNACDRLLRAGSVVDFFDFHYKGWVWPTFNVADISIVMGVSLFLLDMAKHEMRLNRKGRDEDFPDAFETGGVTSSPKKNAGFPQ